MAWLSVRCRAFDEVQEVKGQGTRFTEQTPRVVGTHSAVVASGWSSPGQLLPRAGARKEGQDLADGGFLAGGFRQREVRLDLVAVAAAVFLLDDVSGCGQVGDDAEGAALGDAYAGRDVAQPRARVVCDAQQHPGVVGQEAPARPIETSTQFLEIHC